MTPQIVPHTNTVLVFVDLDVAQITLLALDVVLHLVVLYCALELLADRVDLRFRAVADPVFQGKFHDIIFKLGTETIVCDMICEAFEIFNLRHRPICTAAEKLAVHVHFLSGHNYSSYIVYDSLTYLVLLSLL